MPTDLDNPRFWIMVRVVIGGMVVLLVGTSLLTGLDQDGGRDWDYFQADLLSARQSILDHGELPFWMPHRSGGHDAFADPQSAWFSPFGLLVLIFNFPVGVRLYLIGCACFGALGAVQLGRDLKLSPWACGLMSVILYLSMPMGLYAAGGIPSFTIGWAVLPWLVLLVQRCTPWSTVIAGLILAVALYSGDPNHFVWHSVFLAFFGLGLSVTRQTWTPLAAVLATGVSAAVFAMPKMLPMWLMSQENPRLVGLNGTGSNTLSLTYHALLQPFPPYLEQPQGEFVCLLQTGELVSYKLLNPRLISQLVPGTQIDWVNIGCYIGWLTVLLMSIGIVVLLVPIFRRAANTENPRSRSVSAKDASRSHAITLIQRPMISVVLALALASSVFFLLSLGTNSTPSLWALLHQLPVFSSMKSPVRLLVYVLLPISLLASIGLDGITAMARDRLDHQTSRIFAVVLTALVFLDVHLPVRHLYRVAFCEPALALPTSSPKCFQHEWDGRDNTSTLYAPPVTPAVRGNMGLVNGYTVFNTNTNVIACSSDAGRADVLAPEDLSIVAEDIEFTARSIRFSCLTDGPVEFTINQNWYQGWEVVEPQKAEVSATDDGRIAVLVPKGKNTVRLQYTPPGLFHGITALAFALPPWLFLIARIERRKLSRLEANSDSP